MFKRTVYAKPIKADPRLIGKKVVNMQEDKGTFYKVVRLKAI